MRHQNAVQLRIAFIWSGICAILIINAWFIHFNFQNVSEQESWVTHTSTVLSELDQTLSAAKDTETGARGFILTNNNEYLGPFQKGKVEAFEHLNRVLNLVQDNPEQKISIESVRTLLQKRFEILEGVLARFRDANGKIDRQALQLGEGRIVMDQLRDQVEKMKKSEQDLLKFRSTSADRSREFFFWTLMLTTFVSFTAISFAFYRMLNNQKRLAFESLQQGMTADVARLGTGEASLEVLGRKSLEYLSKSFGVLSGRLFIKEQGRLRPVVAYGIEQQSLSGTPDLVSGLVEASASRDQLWEVTDVPQNYWRIGSSLGSAVPQNLTFLPLSFQGKEVGVFELATFSRLAAEQKELLGKLAATFGIGLSAAQSKEHLQILLERTQQQAEELEAQQEELKTNNEELEQQARALESQQQALNIKNKELENTQSQLEVRAAELTKSSQYKSDFLAKMSHELRTPLNGLLILSTLLVENKEKNLTSQQKEFAKSIYNAGNDLLVLINDILDLSKIEARKLSLRAEDFTLEALFQSKHRSFDPQMAAKNLEFVTPLSDELKTLRLHTDRQRLDQILRNFLSNAIKFTEEGTISLTASVDSAQKYVTLTVSDTGVGIPKSKQDLIFEAFEQADSSVSRKYGGTGLGLTISRELAALLGGEILVASEEGKGSQFSLRIPMRLSFDRANERAIEDVVSLQTAKMESTLAPNTLQRVQKDVREALTGIDPAKKSIMVVEDDEKFRKSVVETIRSHDFWPIEVGDGEVALGVLEQHIPSAILLDIKLPGISGLGILEMIKQLPHLRHVPVHMISALEYQHNALRMGALGYLTKPVTTEKVRSALGRIENLLSKKVSRVLLIEDDERQSHAVSELISGTDIEVVPARSGKAAITELKKNGVDCIILDLTLPDVSGFDLLAELSALEISLPPIVIYTGKDLSDEEEAYLRRYSESIIIKGARSPERLLDEVNLFLHRVESLLPTEKREMLSNLRSQEKSFEGKTVLVVDDDIRNIFALTSALETKGLKVKTARNGQECLDVLDSSSDVDLVIMDIMMPKMDGFEAMRRIRKDPDPRTRSLPIVALTAKAMREDHEKCMEAGASDYLPKPVNLDNLTTVLRVWLAPKGFLG